MPETPRKVSSLQELADLAGVSRATASRALNDSPLISDATKQKLRELARQHDYTLNQRARNFRLQRTNVISVVFMLDIRSEQHMSDPFFLDMLGAIADSLSEHDYDLLLAHAPVANVLDLQSSRVLRQSDGTIFVGQEQQHEELNALAAHHPRMVVWGYPVENRNYVVVGGDNEKGGYDAARHLLENGRRRIAFFGNTANLENAARYAGYSRALAEYGLDPDSSLKFDVPFEMQGARQAVLDIVEAKVELDAVVCASDVTALATISTLQESAIRVPEDVAVVGYDDIGLAAYGSPPLTTVRQNIRLAGRLLVEAVLDLINDQPVGDTIIDSELIVRKSSGAPAAGES